MSSAAPDAAETKTARLVWLGHLCAWLFLVTAIALAPLGLIGGFFLVLLAIPARLRLADNWPGAFRWAFSILCCICLFLFILFGLPFHIPAGSDWLGYALIGGVLVVCVAGGFALNWLAARAAHSAMRILGRLFGATALSEMPYRRALTVGGWLAVCEIGALVFLFSMSQLISSKPLPAKNQPQTAPVSAPLKADPGQHSSSGTDGDAKEP
jgi:hypothetical protein